MKTILLILSFSFALFADALYTESFITPPQFKPANHGSALVALPDGYLLACWYAGHHEGARDVEIYCVRSGDNGKVWGYPSTVVGVGEYPRWAPFKNKTVGNVALYLDDDNKLWMFYSAVMIGGWSGSHVDYKVSSDFGRSWSRSNRFAGTFGNLPRNKPIKIARNKFFLPLYHEFTSFQGYGCMIDTENGAIKKSRCYNIPGKKHGQPTFVKMNDTQVFAYLRTKGIGKTLFSSFDLKRNTWSKPQALELPNPDAAVDAIMSPHGVLMVLNNSKSSRIPLSLVLSTDGIHFKHLYDFEAQFDSSYPALIQEGDDYYLSYTYKGREAIKSVHFNTEWLLQRIK